MWEWHCRCQLPNNSWRILGFTPNFVVGLHIQNAEDRSLVSESKGGDTSSKSLPSYMTKALFFSLSHSNSHLVYLFSPSPCCWFSLSLFSSVPNSTAHWSGSFPSLAYQVRLPEGASQEPPFPVQRPPLTSDGLLGQVHILKALHSLQFISPGPSPPSPPPHHLDSAPYTMPSSCHSSKPLPRMSSSITLHTLSTICSPPAHFLDQPEAHFPMKMY